MHACSPSLEPIVCSPQPRFTCKLTLYPQLGLIVNWPFILRLSLPVNWPFILRLGLPVNWPFILSLGLPVNGPFLLSLSLPVNWPFLLSLGLIVNWPFIYHKVSWRYTRCFHQVRAVPEGVPVSDLRVPAVGHRAGEREEDPILVRQQRARAPAAAAVVNPAATPAAHGPHQQTVDRHRVPGGRPHDRLQGYGAPGASQPRVSTFKLEGGGLICTCTEIKHKLEVRRGHEHKNLEAFVRISLQVILI